MAVAKKPVVEEKEVLPPLPPKSKPLVLKCARVESNVKLVLAEEGKGEKGEPLFGEVMRNVNSAFFMVDELDLRKLPQASVSIDSLDILPFETGKSYELELVEVEKDG